MATTVTLLQGTVVMRTLAGWRRRRSCIVVGASSPTPLRNETLASCSSFYKCPRPGAVETDATLDQGFPDYFGSPCLHIYTYIYIYIYIYIYLPIYIGSPSRAPAPCPTTRYMRLSVSRCHALGQTSPRASVKPSVEHRIPAWNAGHKLLFYFFFAQIA
jgi:hypothetical protein